MPKTDNTTFYLSALKKYGVSPRGVHWLDGEKQRARFDVICSLLPDDLSTLSIIDAGCGFGDFYLYLQKEQKTPYKYIGIDIVETFCTLAHERTNQEIHCCDLLHKSVAREDYVICSGALNILTPFETHLFIQNCYDSAKIGLIFNVLYGKKESKTYNFVTKEMIERIAHTMDVSTILYKEGYLKNDITVGFFR